MTREIEKKKIKNKRKKIWEKDEKENLEEGQYEEVKEATQKQWYKN